MKYDTVEFLEELFRPGCLELPPTLPDLNLTPNDLDADWHVLWDERAAIKEFDGGFPREQAEALALTEILAIMREHEAKSIDAATRK